MEIKDKFSASLNKPFHVTPSYFLRRQWKELILASISVWCGMCACLGWGHMCMCVMFKILIWPLRKCINPANRFSLGVIDIHSSQLTYGLVHSKAMLSAGWMVEKDGRKCIIQVFPHFSVFFLTNLYLPLPKVTQPCLYIFLKLGPAYNFSLSF